MTQPVTPPASPGWAQRAQTGLRYLLLTGVMVAAAGIAGRLLSWPLVTSTIGPTAYVFAAHPRTEAARFRSAVIGHSVGVGAGLGALYLFGLAHHPSVSATGAPTFSQAAAAALAAGTTVLVLELARSHHAPAAATSLLVATGLAKPGAPLVGLVLGLAIVIILGSLTGRIPLATGSGTEPQTHVPGDNRCDLASTTKKTSVP